MKVSDIEKYLRTDSTHTFDHSAFNVIVLDECTFSIDDQIIFLLGERDAALLDWPKYDINYVIDATGVYLTTSKAQAHNVDYVIMCAPPKDEKITPQFVVNGNHEEYSGDGMCVLRVLRVLHVLRVLCGSYIPRALCCVLCLTAPCGKVPCGKVCRRN